MSKFATKVTSVAIIILLISGGCNWYAFVLGEIRLGLLLLVLNAFLLLLYLFGWLRYID